MKICSIVPVYNHGLEARAVVGKLLKAGLDVMLVDDASADKTARILDKLASSNSRVTVIRHAVNQGKGGAVMSGLHAAKKKGFTHALQIDADGQHDATDIPVMIKTSAENPGAVIAGAPIFDECVPKVRFYLRYISHASVWLETLSFDIKDSMCGFRVYPLAPVLQIISKARLGRRMDFDPEILVRLHWHGLQFITIRTKVLYPEDGHSNFLPWKDNLLVIWLHTRLVLGMLIRLPKILGRRNRGVKNPEPKYE